MIVSNTTPISNLLRLDKISILPDLFSAVYIPPAVADELNVAFSSSRDWQKYIDTGQIIIHEISNDIFVNQMIPFLHLGEAQAICLCMELKAKIFLIDDKDGRTIANLNKIPMTGTLGILLRAKKDGLIPNVKQLMDRLRDECHFWIKQELYEKALFLANEKQ